VLPLRLILDNIDTCFSIIILYLYQNTLIYLMLFINNTTIYLKIQLFCENKLYKDSRVQASQFPFFLFQTNLIMSLGDFFPILGMTASLSG
jgi:hypothetical protein